MKRISLLAIYAAILSSVLAMPALAQQDAWASPIVITLVPEANVDDTYVMLDQIAKISGGTLDTRRRVAKLDVAEFRLFAERLTITEDQVKFRMLIAGMKSDQFRITGSKRVNVFESEDSISIRRIRACAESALLKAYPGDSSKITIGMKQEFVIPQIYVRQNDRVQYEAKVGPHLPPSGKSRVDVSVIVNGRTREIVPVVLDVIAPESAIVQASGTAKPSAAPVRPVADFSLPKNQPYLVKRNDFVKMVAFIGKIRIETVGEAMQEGRLHETIRVRNIESNRVVPGRVSAQGIVEVDY
jgi:Chaperone for flagella basal body P-ring formation